MQTRRSPTTSETCAARCASEQGGGMLEGVEVGGWGRCAGRRLRASELPVVLVQRHGLGRRIHERGGEPEVRFLLHGQERVLPVWLDGQLLPVRWGNRRGQSRGLPCTAWTRRET